MALRTKDSIHDFARLLALDVRQQTLLRLLMGQQAVEKDFRLLFDELDIDTANSYFLLMLSHYGYRRGWANFPAQAVPRLQGIHRFYQVKNTTLLPGSLSLVKKLRECGIPVMLIKGAAMMAYYDPGVPRMMSDMDILVPPQEYERAVRMGEDAGFNATRCGHSTDLNKGMSTVDIHRWLLKNGHGNILPLWQRAIPVTYHGVDVLVPSREDLYVLTLVNEFGNVCMVQAQNRQMKWLYDGGILAGGLDWERTAAIAADLHVESAVRILSEELVRCLPQLAPPRPLADLLPPSIDTKRLLSLGLAYRAALKRYRKTLCHGSLPVLAVDWAVMIYMEYRYQRCTGTIFAPGFLVFLARRQRLTSPSQLPRHILHKMRSLCARQQEESVCHE